MSLSSQEQMMRHAKSCTDLTALAFAGVISLSIAAGRRPLIRGLSDDRFERLVDTYFPGLDLANGEAGIVYDRLDQFDDVLGMLLEYRVAPTEERAWLCHAIASATMGANHLWQDMGLPNRRALSDLMTQNFPRLTAKNVGDMKWKKFFYRQLCERANIPSCKSPSCTSCADYPICFGDEAREGEARSIPVPGLRIAS
jgi:nitrogen fixation protein NifQ